MCKTVGKWVVSQLCNFDFIKAKVDKHFSSSTLPIICTMANSNTQGNQKIIFKMLLQGAIFQFTH